MKTLFHLGAMLLILATVSCKDDDGGGAPAEPENSFSFDGKTYQMNYGFIEDWGPANVSMEGEEDTHYNYDFYLTDATVTPSGAQGLTYLLYSELYSSGSGNFQTGTFKWVDHENLTEDDVNNANFFVALLAEDGNGDGDLGDSQDRFHEPTGGTITVSGTDLSAYTITYDLRFSDNRRLQGSYTGEFDYFDERDGERAPTNDWRKLEKKHPLIFK
ncbi:hypothetical protein [Cesiribacter andamanensis]|uniref:Uncharacterized protein n=1 Tax=Cesiribacter andamanensis AMV16 TaxID=1279009 RepID=M7NVY7_9BACT|nr:hypothetical protein [Cesiribacter andamanensis]EMR02634.1 hypothetical protein ADICEAN_02233 [Cesiribacter andamanensis AMV16]